MVPGARRLVPGRGRVVGQRRQDNAEAGTEREVGVVGLDAGGAEGVGHGRAGQAGAGEPVPNQRDGTLEPMMRQQFGQRHAAR